MYRLLRLHAVNFANTTFVLREKKRAAGLSLP
jgi:hypothetical protein